MKGGRWLPQFEALRKIRNKRARLREAVKRGMASAEVKPADEKPEKKED